MEIWENKELKKRQTNAFKAIIKIKTIELIIYLQDKKGTII